MFGSAVVQFVLGFTRKHCRRSFQRVATAAGSHAGVLLWLERQHTAMLRLLSSSAVLLACADAAFAVSAEQRALLGSLSEQRRAAVVALAAACRGLPSELMRAIVLAAGLTL